MSMFDPPLDEWMMTEAEIRVGMIHASDKFIEHPRGEYGGSGVGFCNEKFVIRARYGIPEPTNAAMFQGQLFHMLLPEIVKNTSYGLAHGSTKKERWAHRKLAPKFEKEVPFEDPRGFKILGHIDCDLPACDRIIELKSTAARREWKEGDFLTNAYMLQANSYAVMNQRTWFEIWVVWLGFENLAEDPFFSNIKGEADELKFMEFRNKVDYIHKAIERGKDLVGPEQPWECKHCGLIWLCPIWKNLLLSISERFPMEKPKDDADADLIKAFQMYYDRNWIHFDRSRKVYLLDGFTIQQQEETKRVAIEEASNR